MRISRHKVYINCNLPVTSKANINAQRINAKADTQSPSRESRDQSWPPVQHVGGHRHGECYDSIRPYHHLEYGPRGIPLLIDIPHVHTCVSLTGEVQGGHTGPDGSWRRQTLGDQCRDAVQHNGHACGEC
jgi:hypothetical protein